MKWHGHWQFCYWQWWHWQPPHSQASPSVDAEEPLGDYGTDQWWWSSPPPVALQCCRLPDKGLDPHNFDLHHLLHHHHHLCSSLFWYWKGQGSSSANLQKKINCNMRKMAWTDSKNTIANNRRKQVVTSDRFIRDERNLWCCPNFPLKGLMLTQDLLNYIYIRGHLGRILWRRRRQSEGRPVPPFTINPIAIVAHQTPAREWAPFKVCGK